MINDWITRGMKYSKNPIFKKFLGKAGGFMTKPLKLALLMTSAYGKLVDIDSAQSGFAQLKEFMFTFIRMVKAYVSGEYRQVATKSMLIGVAVLLYLVTPLDIIPDFIPAIGLLDDISLMAWFVDAFQKEISKFVEWENDRNFDHTRIGSL